jgi:adenosylmethionine-8-amino-7-oxononanoate aminotransferase
LENLDIFEEEGLNARVRENSPIFRAELEKLKSLPIVGDVRGDGYFFAIELVADQAKKTKFTAEQREKLLRGYLPEAMLNAGLYARADDRQDSVITLAPPLTVGPAEFVEIRQILETVLADGLNHI